MYLTLEDLIKLSPEDLARVESICYKNGEFRCKTVGISNISYKIHDNSMDYEVNWEDEAGGPTIIVGFEELINRVSYHNYEFTLKLPKAAKKKYRAFFIK